jgi:tetratricopeptide (TPR) repeat protein
MDWLARRAFVAVNLPEMKLRICLAGLLLAVCGGAVLAQHKPIPPSNSGRTLTILTEPDAIVWLDEIRRGTTDAVGKLSLVKVSPGAHSLRVRASGFKEVTLPIQPARRGEIRVRLMRTTDEAELAFQRAETAREQAKDDQSRQKSAGLYRQALQLRPALPAAHVGLARVLMDLNDANGGLAEIEAARRYQPVYPEASAAEGRIYREKGQTDEAIGSFNRAIRESHGFQPEAHVGLGRVYEEKGQYELAAREYQIAINQLSDTEPIIYQLLGAAYERIGKNKGAVVAYENYLRLAPNGSLAPAVRSILEQLKANSPN